MDAGKDTQGRTARACADDAARLCSTAAAYLAALAAELIPDELGEHGGGTKCPATAAFAATSRMEHAALSLLRGAEAVRDMSTSAYGNPSETYRERVTVRKLCKGMKTAAPSRSTSQQRATAAKLYRGIKARLNAGEGSERDA